MTFRSTTLSLAVAMLTATSALIAQSTPAPSKSMEKAEKKSMGGEFSLSGCLSQEAGRSGQPMFKVTNVKPGQDGIGEGKAVGAMGGGTPVTGVTHSSAAEKQDMPDVVKGEYRVIAGEHTDLAKFVGQQVELRGQLRQDSKMSGNSASMANAPAATASLDVFEAASVKKLSGTCTAAAGK